VSGEQRERIAIGSDHNGVATRAEVRRALEAAGYAVLDFGPSDETPVDYPDVAAEVATAVAEGEASWGVLMCGTGIGMSIAANKVPGIRAALCADTYIATMSREHNDANVLCLAGRERSPESALPILQAWMATMPSPDERHQRRRQKVATLDRRSQASESPAARDR
jgi:ribose 5-phosphate isomerase B